MYLNMSGMKTTGMQEKRCLWLRECGKNEERGYREPFERIGTGVLWSPGRGSIVFLWNETKRIANIMKIILSRELYLHFKVFNCPQNIILKRE